MGAPLVSDLTGSADELAGRIDGETAAIAGLGVIRAQAITTMAADHNPAYADGYWGGYLTALVVITGDLAEALEADLNAHHADHHQGALAA